MDLQVPQSLKKLNPRSAARGVVERSRDIPARWRTQAYSSMNEPSGAPMKSLASGECTPAVGHS
jgi:hypothetical protein